MSKVIEIKVILKTKCQKKKFSFKAKKKSTTKKWEERNTTHCDFKTKLLQRLTSRSKSIMNNLHNYMYACTQVM